MSVYDLLMIKIAESIFFTLLFWLGCHSYSASGNTVVYTNDFEGTVGAEWSSNNTSTTPSGASFLGLFRNDETTLTIPSVPDSTITLSFELYIIGTWDGNAPIPEAGPDIWELSIANGENLVRTTFGQWPGFTRVYGQAYPGRYPTAAFPFRTGSSLENTLGYTEPFWGGGGDSVYSLSFEFEHTNEDLRIVFSGNLRDTAINESWGIDNIQVTTSVPEPNMSFLLFTCCFAAVIYERRYRCNAV